MNDVKKSKAEDKKHTAVDAETPKETKKEFVWHPDEEGQHQDGAIIERKTEKTGRSIARRIFAGIFGSIGISLILLSFVTVWANRVVSDPATFSKATSPLIQQPEIQNFVSDKLTDEILKNASQAELINSLLAGQDLSKKSTTEIQDMLKTKVHESLMKALGSSQASTVWKNSTLDLQLQFKAIAKSNDTVATIDARRSFNDLIGLLKSTDLSFIKLGDISKDAGLIKINADQTKSIRDTFNTWNSANIALLGTALVSLTLAVAISDRRKKTVRRLAIGISIVMLIILAIVASPSHMTKPNNIDQDAWDAILSAIKIATTSLKTYAYSILGVALATVAGTFLVPMVMSRMEERKSNRKPA